MILPALLGSLTALAQEAPLVALPEGTSDLRKLSGTYEASFPVRLGSPGVALRLLEIEHEGGPPPGAPFTVTLSAPQDGALGEIGVRATEALAPGVYTLRLFAEAPDAEGAPLDLRVSAPAARVRVAPNPAIFDAILPVFQPGPRPGSRTLDVMELGGERGVSRLLASPASNAVSGDGSLGTSLFEPIAPIAISPGGAAAFALELQEDLPLGTSTLNLELSAPELDAPLSVPVELRVRRPAWLILVAAFCGASVQLLQKMIFPWLNVRLLEDEQVRALRAFIDREAHAEDAALKAALTAARQQLPRAFSTKNPLSWASQQAEIDRIRSDVEAAVRVHNERMTQLGERSEALGELVAKRFQLPGSCRPKMDAVAAAQTHAREALRVRAADPAEQALEEADRALSEALIAARSWADAVARQLRGLNAGVALIPNPAPEGLLQRHEAALAALGNEAITGDILIGSGSAGKALAATHQATRLSKALVVEHGWHLNNTADRLIALLHGQKDGLAAFQARWRPYGFNAEQTTAEKVHAIWDTARALFEAVGAALGALDKLSAEVSALREAGSYAEAIDTALGRQGPDVLSEPTPSGETDGGAPAEEAGGEEPAEPPAVGSLEVPEAEVPEQPKSIAVLLLETALAYLILGGLVWTSYADQFVGTASEMAAIFAFAYGTNLGLDQLLARVGSKGS